MKSAELQILDEKIAAQAEYVDLWHSPSEPIVFETRRAIDNLYCEELVAPDRAKTPDDRLYHSLLTWGVNHALARTI